MKKYEKYKNSNVDWLGDIPEQWNTLPIRSILEERNEKNNGPKTDYILSVTKDRGVIPYDEKGAIGNNKSENIEGYKVVYEGDFVINKMNVVIGSLGMSKFYGAFSQVYLVYKPKSSNINLKYYSYIFSNPSFYKSLIKYCTGIMELRESLNKEDFKNLILPFPEYSIQSKIIEFLDDKTSKIDQAIDIKLKQIELLKERRQVQINKVVTRGLNNSAEFKNSGFEWIGKIPEHWEIIKNGALFEERKESGNENLPLLSVSIHSAVSSEELENNIRGQIKIEDKTKYKLVKVGDIVFNMMRAWQGAIGSVQVNGMVSPAYVVASPKKTFDSNFFEYQYRTRKFIQQMDRVSKGITDFRKRLYWNEFKQLATIFPPIDEQILISEFISNLTIKTDSIISLKEKEIEKLKEYKMSLIDGVVTGKVKVC